MPEKKETQDQFTDRVVAAAAVAWDNALRSDRPAVDWFLGQAQSLDRLGQTEARVEALEAARHRNPSAVLYQTWLRALVDAGDLDQAEAEVEGKLATVRWKASWLLLRARIRAAQGQVAAQQVDARAAMEEIKVRWRSATGPGDPFLLVHAGLAFALLGEPDEAHRHLEAARRRGVPEARLHEYERAVAQLLS